jgi:hypothetical protein
MTLLPTIAEDARARLRTVLGDRIILAGDAGYDDARLAWNRAVDQRPFALCFPESADEVVDIVRAATASGLRIAPQSTGHGAGALADTDLSDVVLVSLSRLRGVTVYPEAQSARVLGGSLWSDVLTAAAPYGLTALHGSAADVSVVGYALSGGLSFYARAHGLAVNSVSVVTLVTADGRLVRASRHAHRDLFWAVRGGSGAFGIVVSVELDLLPYADVFAGMLLWDAARASEVAHAWRDWTATAPESATTSLRIMHFPPAPELPPFLSGRSVVVIDGAVVEADAAASTLLEPLRALRPEIDTFARMPSDALLAVHMDPPGPTPSVLAHAMLATLPAAAVDAFVSAAVLPGPTIAELRHVGGAASRRPHGGGAIASLAGDYLVGGIGMVPAPDELGAAWGAVRAFVAALAEWHIDSLALTFIDGGVDRAAAFGASAVRLAELKREFDPADVFAAGHPVAR